MSKKFTDEEFLHAIKSSKNHSEACKRLGYKASVSVRGNNTLYAQLYAKLHPDLSHFGKFTEEEFLKAIQSSNSHKEAGYKLGYNGNCHVDASRYGKLFKKLRPDVSHFITYCQRSGIKYNIPQTYDSNEYKREYYKIRRELDPKFRLSMSLRTRIRSAMKNNQKIGSAIRDLGCSINKFKLWIEMLWTDGMSWSNYGEWVLDHVKPLASFDLTDGDQFLEVCHFTNIQPMWKDENLTKRDKILENASFYSKIGNI